MYELPVTASGEIVLALAKQVDRKLQIERCNQCQGT